MSITLSIKQIMDLAEFAGLSVQSDDPSQLEVELTVVGKQKVKLDDGSVYEGAAAYFRDIPEEGSLPLEEVCSSNTKAPGAARPKQCWEGGPKETCSCPDHGRSLIDYKGE